MTVDSGAMRHRRNRTGGGYSIFETRQVRSTCRAKGPGGQNQTGRPSKGTPRPGLGDPKGWGPAVTRPGSAEAVPTPDVLGDRGDEPDAQGEDGDSDEDEHQAEARVARGRGRGERVRRREILGDRPDVDGRVVVVGRLLDR